MNKQNDIFLNNKTYVNKLKKENGNVTNSQLLICMQNNTNFANFLFVENGIQEDINSYISKSSAILNKYSDNKFWLDEPYTAFIKLLNEIKKDNFNLDDIYYIISKNKIISGFSVYFKDYLKNSIESLKLKKKQLLNAKRNKKIEDFIQLVLNEFIKDIEIPEELMETENKNK